MTLDWIRLNVNFAVHRKTMKVSPLARLLFVMCLLRAQGAKRTGFLEEEEFPLLYFQSGAGEEHRAELLKVGFLEAVDDGYQIHDYEDYNPTREEIDAKRQARAEAGRLGGIKSGETRRNRSSHEAFASPLLQHDAKQNGSTSTIRNDTSTDRSSRGLKSSLGSARDARVDAVLDAFGLTLSDANYEGMEKICYKPEFEGLDWAAIAEHAIEVVRAKGDEVRFPKRLLETFLLNEVKKSPNGRTMDAVSIEERERLKWEAQANDPVVKAGHERLQRQKRERLAREQAEKERMEAENREGTQ